MNTYIVSYDLCNPGQNYEQLLRLIRRYSAWARLGGSAYIIETSDTAKNVRDYLSRVLDRNDKLFIGTIKAEAAWYGLGDEVSQWLINKLKK